MSHHVCRETRLVAKQTHGGFILVRPVVPITKMQNKELVSERKLHLEAQFTVCSILTCQNWTFRENLDRLLCECPPKSSLSPARKWLALMGYKSNWALDSRLSAAMHLSLRFFSSDTARSQQMAGSFDWVFTCFQYEPDSLSRSTCRISCSSGWSVCVASSSCVLSAQLDLWTCSHSKNTAGWRSNCNKDSQNREPVTIWRTHFGFVHTCSRIATQASRQNSSLARSRGTYLSDFSCSTRSSSSV